MAEDKKKSNKAVLARLIPESVTIKVGDKEVVVAGNKTENVILNKVLVAELRAYIKDNMQRYRDKDVLPSPKELGDLIRGAAELIRVSGDVYKEEEPNSGSRRAEEKNVTPTDIAVDFNNLTKKKDGEAPGVNGKEPLSESSSETPGKA